MIRRRNNLSPARIRIMAYLGIGVLLFAGFTEAYNRYSVGQLQREPLDLPVAMVQQSLGTSCGEAVIAMVYNFAYPATPISEAQVIEYAASQGYFTEGIPPYTSPVNMVNIARHYANDVDSGTVSSSNQGLSLLIQRLQDGEPLIIDVLSNFSDPESEAHFIVVTGISVDPLRENAVIIHYNDPLTGIRESDDWLGANGVWNAWKNNGDPGGPGWWLVISPS